MQRVPRLHIGRPAGALLGSVANVIVFETAKRDGVETGFGEYLRAGIPITIETLLIAWAWLSFL